MKVLPAFRPETALHPEQVSFRDWVARLGEVTGRKIAALEDLEEALAQRAAYFQERGCLIADQSLQSPDFTTGTRQEAEAAFVKALAGEVLSPAEQNAYQTQLLLSLGRLYKKMGFVMQLHFGVLRNTNSRMFPRTGPDAGFDCAGDGVSAASMAALFDALDKTDELPPTVIYSLNACDDDKLASVLGAFQQGTFPQKMQLGGALVVLRPQGRHGEDDEGPGQHRAAFRVHRHAHRLPELPLLRPPRVLPPGALRPVGPVDGGRGDSGR